MDIFITYNEDSQLEKLKNIGKDRDDLSFRFIDSRTKDGKKESLSLKSYWGAKIDPFAIVIKDTVPVKAFYSEAEDVISNLKLYLEK